MTRYAPAIDVEAITALDVHACTSRSTITATRRFPRISSRRRRSYFKAGGPRPDLVSIAAYYRERAMAAVVFTVDAEDQPRTGADLVRGDRGRRRGATATSSSRSGSVDPHRLDGRRPHRAGLVEDSGVRGSSSTRRCRVRPERGAHVLAVRRSRGAGVARPVPHRADRHRRRPPGRLRTRASALSNPILLDRHRRATSPTSRSSWRTRPCRGRTRRSRWRPTSTTRGSTCPAGARKYFPESLVRAANSYLEEPRPVRVGLPAADPRPLDRGRRHVDRPERPTFPSPR